MNCSRAEAGTPSLDPSRISIAEANDFTVVPQDMLQTQRDRFPEARVAFLKSGGDFPFLSRPEEMSLHIEVHLRRAGLQPEPKELPYALSNSEFERIFILISNSFFIFSNFSKTIF